MISKKYSGPYLAYKEFSIYAVCIDCFGVDQTKGERRKNIMCEEPLTTEQSHKEFAERSQAIQ
jgi:hypothetical protein